MKKVILAALIATTLGACATGPATIAPAYVSTMEYQDLNCDQIQMEYITNKLAYDELFQQMESDAKRSAAAVSVGILVAWPALFFMKGKDPVKDARLSELKGRQTALDLSMGNCEGKTTRTTESILEERQLKITDSAVQECREAKQAIEDLPKAKQPSMTMKNRVKRTCKNARLELKKS